MSLWSSDHDQRFLTVSEATRMIAAARGWPDDLYDELSAIWSSTYQSEAFLVAAGDLFAGLDPEVYPGAEGALAVVISELESLGNAAQARWESSPLGVVAGTMVDSAQDLRDVGELAGDVASAGVSFLSTAQGKLAAAAGAAALAYLIFRRA